jgi:glycerol kinase
VENSILTYALSDTIHSEGNFIEIIRYATRIITRRELTFLAHIQIMPGAGLVEHDAMEIWVKVQEVMTEAMTLEHLEPDDLR